MRRSLFDEILYQAFGVGGKKKKKGKYKGRVLRYNGEPWAYRHTNGKVEKYDRRKR
jgi:hypothetical protein